MMAGRDYFGSQPPAADSIRESRRTWIKSNSLGADRLLQQLRFSKPCINSSCHGDVAVPWPGDATRGQEIAHPVEARPAIDELPVIVRRQRGKDCLLAALHSRKSHRRPVSSRPHGLWPSK